MHHAFNAFFKSNPQIQQLKLYLSANCLDLRAIEHLQCLEKCSIAFTPTAHHKEMSLKATFVSLYKGLTRIGTLRALYIGFDSFYHDLIAELESLNILYVFPLFNNCDDSEWKGRLRLLSAKLNNLTECFLHTHSIHLDTMIEFITNAAQLKTVHVLALDKETYMRIVKLCIKQNRSIQIMYRGDPHDIDEYIDLCRIHRNYTSIQECSLHKNYFEFPEAAVLRAV